MSLPLVLIHWLLNFAAFWQTHPTDLIHGNGAPLALVLDPLRCVDGHRLVREEGERELDDHPDQSLRVEDELIPGNGVNRGSQRRGCSTVVEHSPA